MLLFVCFLCSPFRFWLSSKMVTTSIWPQLHIANRDDGHRTVVSVHIPVCVCTMCPHGANKIRNRKARLNASKHTKKQALQFEEIINWNTCPNAHTAVATQQKLHVLLCHTGFFDWFCFSSHLCFEIYEFAHQLCMN